MILTVNDNILKTRQYLKNRLLSDENHYSNFQKARIQLSDLFKRTIDTGESNSALLIGPRGIGKTTLVNNVIQDLKQLNTFKSNTVLVKLHGLIHTDDRLALKSVTTQLNLDNAVDGQVFGSFAENLAFLLACLRTGQKTTSKSVLFILDEFDLFCQHHNQTLLYNLFDVSQSAQTPICVFGITCRLDVIELLEKRVKSRFSHRQIFLLSSREENNGNSDLEMRLEKIENYLTLPNDVSLNMTTNTRNQWNKSVEDLLKNKKFIQMMQRLLDINPNDQIMTNILVLVVSKLADEKPNISVEDFQEEVDRLEADELTHILQDLSALEICVLIAMKHHVEIYDNQPMNYEMIYTRYAKFANANSSMQSLQRSVIMKAFEHLHHMELIVPINSSTWRLQKEYQMFKLLVSPQQIMEAVKKCTGLPTEVIHWANSSLV